jgi:RNA polymerase sigma-70 factor (ECF subfamily)
MATGDQNALARFYDATASKAYGLILTTVRNKQLAEEIMADVYMQVWRQATRYDPTRGNVMAWVLTICRSRAIDSLRRTEPFESLDDIDMPEAAAEPLDLLVSLENHTRIHSALMLLDGTQRQLLSLAFYRGLTHSELSASTGMPLGTVKTLVLTGLEKMRALLLAKNPTDNRN